MKTVARWTLISCSFFLLFGCGQPRNPSTTVRFKFATPVSSPRLPRTQTNYPPPPSDSDFDCFAINVMGADIASSVTAPTADSVAQIQGGSTCSYPGILSPLIPASSTATTVSLTVPAGSARIFQVLGIKSNGGCSGISLAEHFTQTIKTDTSIPGIYEIGRTVVDVKAPQTVSVTSNYVSTAAREVRCHCKLPPFQIATAYAFGSGTTGDPYHICTAPQLQLTGNPANLGTAQVLDQIVDLTGFSFTPIGSLGPAYTGTFDGQGYGISNFTLSSRVTPPTGFFATVTNGTLLNLKLLNVQMSLSGAASAGALVGNLSGTSTVKNCLATGTITNGKIIGGLIGETTTGSSQITNAFAEVNISTANGTSVGGLIGQFDNAILTHSGATGNVSASSSSAVATGGLIGMMGSLSVPSVATSSATGNVTGISSLGGLIGNLSGGSVTNSYATGAITATGPGSNLGGVIGLVPNGAIGVTLTNLYSSSSSFTADSGSSIGGLIGDPGTISVTNGYSNSAAPLQASGYIGASFTLSQLMLKSTFHGFDFTSIWNIREGSTPSTPFLL